MRAYELLKSGFQTWVTLCNSIHYRALDHQRELPLRAQGWRLKEGDLKGVPCGWSPTEDTGPYSIARCDYWPKMEEEVSGYVRTCRLCQQDKVEQAKPAGWSPCLYQRYRASLFMD